MRTASDPMDTLSTILGRLWADLQGFESSSAREADEALRMEMLRSSAELDNTSFYWQLALMASGSRSFAGC